MRLELLPGPIFGGQVLHHGAPALLRGAGAAEPLMLLRPLGILLSMSVRPGPARAAAHAAAVLLVAALTAACAAPPQKEMDQAEGAITTARAAGAAQYAAEEFAAAEAALARSHEAVEQRDYRQALNHALDARERAQVAARQAADEKALAGSQAERAISAAELELATARQRLPGTAPPTPATRRAAQASHARTLRAVIEAATTRLQEARSHVQAQRYDEALTVATPLAGEIQAAVRAFDLAQVQSPPPRGGRRGR